MSELVCTLPICPTANHLFATDFRTKRRFKSKQYAAWQKEAGALLIDQWKAQGQPIVTHPWSAHITVGINHRTDIDGRVKAALDLLVQTIPGWPDDRYVDRLLVERGGEADTLTIVACSID